MGFFLNFLVWFLFFSITGEEYTLIRWGSYILPWLMGVSIILAIVAMYLKKRILAVSILVQVIFIAYFYPTFFISSQTISYNPSDSSIYKVMSYSKMGRNSDIQAVTRTIINENPDILFVQEISKSEVNSLTHMLSSYYTDNMSFFSDNHVGLILSRFNVELHEKKDKKKRSIIIETPNGNIRVWNVHLQKSFFSTDEQYKEIENLVEEVAGENLPILVAGDFNASGINYPCRILKKYLKDAFETTGAGFGFTFPSAARSIGMITPFMRIDHIFYSKHFSSHHTYVSVDNGGSDHFPVVALFSFK